MLKQLQEQIERLKKAGVTYVDARWYPLEETNQLVMWNGNLKGASASRESGVGVRVLYKGAWGFSASSDLSNLAALFDKAFDNARVAAERVTFPVRLAEKDAIQASFNSPNRSRSLRRPAGDKVAFLKEMDEKLNQPGVLQRVGQLIFMRKQIIFLDSEGSEIEKNIIEVFPSIQVMGVDAQGEMHARKFSPARLGATRGWETLDKPLFTRKCRTHRARDEPGAGGRALPQGRRARSSCCPASCSCKPTRPSATPWSWTASWATSWPFAGGSFVTLDDFGKLRYGSPKLTARADATLPNSPGSFGYDDDGVPAQDNLLIDKGILVGAITGRQMVEEANARARKQIFDGSSGANRATAFYRVPIERMTNINIDPGTDGTLDDIVTQHRKRHHPGWRQELVDRLQPRAVPLCHRYRLAGGRWRR